MLENLNTRVSIILFVIAVSWYFLIPTIKLYNNSNLSTEYYEVFWWEKYSYFLNWLNLYDAPINILLFFIMLIKLICYQIC